MTRARKADSRQIEADILALLEEWHPQFLTPVELKVFLNNGRTSVAAISRTIRRLIDTGQVRAVRYGNTHKLYRR